MSPAAVDPFVAEDLAAATAEQHERIAKAEAELARQDAAVRAAEDQRDAAKASVLTAGLEGRDDSQAAAALSAANAALADAKEVRELRAEVVDTIRAQTLQAVRDERAAAVLQRLDGIRAQYDEQAALLETVAAILGRLGSLRDAERVAAADLAHARRDGTPDAFHGYIAGTGNRYRTIPDVAVAFVVTADGKAREDVASPGHLADKLRRRSEP